MWSLSRFTAITVSFRGTGLLPLYILTKTYQDDFYLNRYILIGHRNNRYFPHTNPYKYANRSSHVTMQRSSYKELLIYRAWATCELTPPDEVHSFHVQHLPHPHSGYSNSSMVTSAAVGTSSGGVNLTSDPSSVSIYMITSH